MEMLSLASALPELGGNDSVPVWAACSQSSSWLELLLLFIRAGNELDTIWAPLVGSGHVNKSG